MTGQDPHVNAEALRLAVKGIEADPENWDQTHWTGVKFPGSTKSVSWDDIEQIGSAVRIKPESEAEGSREWINVEQCRTTYCLAGQAMLQAGMVNEKGWYIDEDGARMNNWQVECQAASLLGLDEQQADELFYWGVNRAERGTLADFKRRITEVTGVTFED